MEQVTSGLDLIDQELFSFHSLARFNLSSGGHMSWHTGCLIKNASTHNFFIYYPISMNKKTDMVFHALDSQKNAYFQ
jgi:hypothetical protein